MKPFLPPLVTPSDEEPIAAGGWCFQLIETGRLGVELLPLNSQPARLSSV